MTTAREDILNRIRRANGRIEINDAPIPHPIPARATGDHGTLVARFIELAGEASVDVSRVHHRADIPVAIADYLAAQGLTSDLRLAPDGRLADLPWDGLTISNGRARPDDLISVTPAFAGIAETGTLMVHSGHATPNSLHFLPETHIAVLQADDIVGGYEDAWALLRVKFDRLPRSVTLITGPSRSSDIERKLQIGVHGPRRLHIVLIDGE